MKKRNLFGALAAGMLFCACSSDNDAINEDLNNVAAEGSQKLVLNLSAGGDGMASRSGRPLLSSAAKQDVNHIVLYVVNKSNAVVDDPTKDGEETIADGNVVLVKTIGASEWANAQAYTNHGKELEITFKKSEHQKLAKGSYDIYAVAYKAEGVNYNFWATKSGKWDANNFKADLKKANPTADEVFAGKLSVKVVESKDDQQNITDSYFVASTADDNAPKPASSLPLILNRQVAGITGYFTNIPAKVGEKVPAKLRVIASKKNITVLFNNLLGAETDGNTQESQTHVVNGTNEVRDVYGTNSELPYFNNSKKGIKVYDIELSKFFTCIGKNLTVKGSAKKINGFSDLDLDGDGFVGYKDAQYYVYDGTIPDAEDVKNNWNHDIHGARGYKSLAYFWKNPNEDKQQLVAGSVFAGEFVIPFAKKQGVHTLELQLLDADGNILKSWNVGDKYNGNDNSAAFGASNLEYSIYRNHMYSLGMKTSDIENPKNPDPKPTPDPEDKPQDLSKGENLLIHINDNWEIIHDMEID